jgi:hypothetical protein
MHPVTCARKVDPAIQGQAVFVEDETYERYIPTEMQFEIGSDLPAQQLVITIPYANKLTDTEAKYCRIVGYDGISMWRVLDTSLNEDEKTLTAIGNATGIYGVFLNDYWYSDITQRIADEYPLWTWIKQSKESNGQRFFNWFAMTLETMEDEFDEIKKQKFIDLLDPHMLDWVWVYDLPDVRVTDDLGFYNGDDPITILDSLRDFFFNKVDGGGIIDYDNRRMYTRKEYSAFRGEIRNIDRRSSFTATALPHQIWNAFDEFGLLTGTKRLYREKNADYRERIKDVFRYPGNSSDQGLTYAIARELNLIRRVTWQDDNKNLYLKGQGVEPHTIRVDGQPLQPLDYIVDEFGHVMLQAQRSGQPRTVSYIKDVEKHELYQKSDEQLYRIMFQDDGQASETLKRWVNYINTVAPIMWGRFNWDEGYWDTISKDLTGLGYLPNIWDSSMDNWKDYTFNPKRWEGSKVWQS